MIIFMIALLAVGFIFIGVLLSCFRSRGSDPTSISYAGRVNRIERGMKERRVFTGQQSRYIRVYRGTRDLEHGSGKTLALGGIGGLWTPQTDLQRWLTLALILGLCCIVSLVIFNSVRPTPVLIGSTIWTEKQIEQTPVVRTTPSTSQFPGVIGVSQTVKRVGQLDPKQYNSTQEYDRWAYSTCSAAAIAAVINAYNEYYRTGPQYRIADILKVESELGEITPQQGLLRPTGIDRTVAKFHFKAQWLNKPRLEDVIKLGNSGRPIIVNFPPDRWSGGHLLIVRGGDKNQVFLVDSSQLNMQKMTHATFLKYWVGFAAVVTPVGR
jgi:hypothetical protein